jgi:hypothetical protein
MGKIRLLGRTSTFYLDAVNLHHLSLPSDGRKGRGFHLDQELGFFAIKGSKPSTFISTFEKDGLADGTLITRPCTYLSMT